VPDFAYLSGGRLFVKLGNDQPREVESPFAESVVKRAASIARRNEWKTQGRGARFMMGMEGIPEELLRPKLDSAVRCTGLSRGRHGAEIIYSLSTGAVCFDVYPDGGVLWSNGKTVMYRSLDGKEAKLGRYGDVGEVLALKTTTC